MIFCRTARWFIDEIIRFARPVKDPTWRTRPCADSMVSRLCESSVPISRATCSVSSKTFRALSNRLFWFSSMSCCCNNRSRWPLPPFEAPDKRDCLLCSSLKVCSSALQVRTCASNSRFNEASGTLRASNAICCKSSSHWVRRFPVWPLSSSEKESCRDCCTCFFRDLNSSSYLWNGTYEVDMMWSFVVIAVVAACGYFKSFLVSLRCRAYIAFCVESVYRVCGAFVGVPVRPCDDRFRVPLEAQHGVNR